MADEMNEDSIRELLEGGAGAKGPPYNPLKQAEIMRDAAALYLAPPTIQPAQIVRQRIGLCVNRREFQATAFVFIRYLEKPVEVNFPVYYYMDCVLGQADPEGDLQFVLADSARFEVYPEEDLQRLGAEAAKAIN